MNHEKVSRSVKSKRLLKKVSATEKFSSRRVGKKADYMDPRWRAVRARILTRDHNLCRQCGCTWDLQVHHVRYVKGGRIWDSPDHDLITLCDSCHRKVHKILSGK